MNYHEQQAERGRRGGLKAAANNRARRYAMAREALRWAKEARNQWPPCPDCGAQTHMGLCPNCDD